MVLNNKCTISFGISHPRQLNLLNNLLNWVYWKKKTFYSSCSSLLSIDQSFSQSMHCHFHIIKTLRLFNKSSYKNLDIFIDIKFYKHQIYQPGTDGAGVFFSSWGVQAIGVVLIDWKVLLGASSGPICVIDIGFGWGLWGITSALLPVCSGIWPNEERWVLVWSWLTLVWPWRASSIMAVSWRLPLSVSRQSDSTLAEPSKDSTVARTPFDVRVWKVCCTSSGHTAGKCSLPKKRVGRERFIYMNLHSPTVEHLWVWNIFFYQSKCSEWSERESATGAWRWAKSWKMAPSQCCHNLHRRLSPHSHQHPGPQLGTRYCQL